MSTATFYPNETNSLPYADMAADYSGLEVALNDPRLARIVRLRLLTDAGYPDWDLSYCYGVLKDGTKCRVNLPVHRFSRRNLKGALIDMARDAGVYAKGLGLLDESVISKLW